MEIPREFSRERKFPKAFKLDVPVVDLLYEVNLSPCKKTIKNKKLNIK